MSLQINLSSREIATAYQDVLNDRGIDWAIFTYEGGTNDLKVQGTGNGGLEELEEEFSDGRIQYAFARVIDPNSKLPKFVQINWCGDGVPEAKKGLFHTHSGAVARYLRGTHVVINARNETDVTPALIMKRVEAASGAKYSSNREEPRKFEPIAPVGTSYTPVGRPDIAALKKAPPAAKPTAPSVPTGTRPTFGATKPAASAASLYGRATGSAPSDAWPDESPATAAPAPPPPPPASTRPPVVPTASRPAFTSFSAMPTKPSPSPAFSAAPAAAPVASPPPPPRPIAVSPTVASPASRGPEKPAEDDRIEPLKSSWTPVSLPAPKKLKNPFAAMEQQAQQQSSGPTPSPSSGAKKLTWSERQALAKKQAEEEEARSRSAAFTPTAPTPVSRPAFTSSAPAFGRATAPSSTPRNFGAVAAVAGAGVAAGAAAAYVATREPSPPPAPPSPPPAASSFIRQREPEPEPEWEEEAPAEPEPEAEPEYEAVSVSLRENWTKVVLI
ncbi:hypothetical protein CVT24_009834 [Panaeolus cyanescens]|uniref:ADF-H domain-containing protein n=1 Tax=Panaeolus cyanescens TaxID=181874 RepID=A0A409VY48_9AGAR|nr:hypothetical protein CVT24_009834 [Panaeolus cyanescens]